MRKFLQWTYAIGVSAVLLWLVLHATTPYAQARPTTAMLDATVLIQINGVEYCGGILIDHKRGNILTAKHCVNDSPNLQLNIRLHDGREFAGRVVAISEFQDSALLKIEAADLPFALLGDSDQVQVGDDVIAIGHPFGLEWSAQRGMVSALNRSIVSVGRFMQIDVQLNPGNSGGALFDRAGRVIGMTTGGFRGSANGLALAVSINDALAAADL